MRTYANLDESLKVARYYQSRKVEVANVKAELLKSNYQVNIAGNLRNVDYKIVEAMMFALQSTATSKPSRTRKPKAKATQPLPISE